MQKIKGILETVIFSLNNPAKTPLEEEELRQHLLEMREILKEYPLEELEDRARVLQGERQIYEEKFVKSLENV